MLDRNARLMIVRDDAIGSIIIGAMAEDLGWVVAGTFSTLAEGLEHARRDALDFALLDFRLGAGEDVMPIVEVLTKRGIPFAFTPEAASEHIHDILPAAVIMNRPLTELELGRTLPPPHHSGALSAAG